ncbi:hypothetical protein LCI18_001095 [Fusarium solani-melongenae]|uniref:Uncharacterized protein n=1 Tax=Fusarium solani subsp. cucurbitae TaxID=2747967 RepID=A0ACD3YMN5_FUSSC|nr:hypothetical protein LCI18_001095 [Fusarium solani-melongenae]
MPVSRPSRRDEFEVAIICALPLEYDAVSYTFDEFWDQDGDPYGRAPNDPNTYTTGRIGNFNVVLALLSRMGKTNAASTAASIAMSFSGLRLALLVGVILLGDVVISSRVIEYDFGRQYPDKFVRKDTLEGSHGQLNKDIRSLLVTLQTDRGLNRLEQRTISFLQKIQADVFKTKHRGKYDCPGMSEDTLFETTHRHKHHGSPCCACRSCFSDSDPVCEEAINSSCAELGCSNGPVVTRERLLDKQRAEQDSEAAAQHPTVHIGLVASGDRVMKSAAERDRLSKEDGVIAFDMEGAGVWDELPCIIVKGVCDYADSHKNKKWQPFAAATAASAAKALLSCYIKTDKPGRKEIERRCSERILSTLWFRMIDDRRETIADAHRETFQWALKPLTCDQPWDDLSHWLLAGAGIYWIAGKAGSGKSTLMKYISSSAVTKTLLSKWAGDGPCTTADFFFWYLGTAEQRTQDGLFRALLYKIFSSHPKLIPEALPAMWKEAYEGRDTIAFPSSAEAEKAFRVIATSPDLGRFCLFVDGLDEYLGNCQDGISFIKRLTAGQNIKVIVSSRPIPDCVAAFRGLPQLDLPDLTRPDIYAYVQDVIGKHPDMSRLSKGDPRGPQQIISDLVDKSSGVFLWVILACRSLISGLARYDDTAQLQSRVTDLPPELEDMFQLMLIKVEPRYRRQASRLLRLCYAEQEARGWTEVTDNYALGLALVTDYQLKSPTEVLSKEKKIRLCRRLEDRLRSHCGGLLEVVKGPATDIGQRFCFCGPVHVDWIDAKVWFMHRTVFEFLRDETVWKLDCLKVEADNEFDAATDLSLSRLHLAMQSLQEHFPHEFQALSCLRDGVSWGSKADHDAPLSRENIFWKMVPFLDSLRAQNFTDPRFTQNPRLLELANAHHDRVDQFSHATLALAAEAGAVNYLKEHPCLLAAVEEREPNCSCPPLFSYAINDESLVGIYWNAPFSSPPWLRACSSDAVVRLLLSSGCDPNKFVSNSYRIPTPSPWVLWLENKHQKLGTTIQEKLSALTTIESFIAAGAKDRPGVSFNIETWFKGLFTEPELIERIRAILRRCQELQTDLVVRSQRKRDESDGSEARRLELKRVRFC